MSGHERNLKGTTLRIETLSIAAWMFMLLAAAGPANSAQRSWKFIVVGDSQGFDNGVNTTILSELASEVVGHRADFLLFCGDLVSCYCSDLENELRAWRSTMQPVYDANIPIYPCRGNHESWGTVAAWQSVFSDLPDNGPPGEKHMTYSVTHRNALIVALDEYVDPHRVNQAWLDTQLAKSTEPLLFVFGHEPAFHAFHLDCLDDYVAERDIFWNSIKKAGGRTYFCGHDHFFDHAHVDDGDGNPHDDIHQYIIGTGGAAFYPFSPPYEGDNSHYRLEQLHHAKRHGYVLVEIEDLRVNLTWMQRETNDLEHTGTYEPNEVWSFSAQPLMLLSPNGGENIVAGSVFSMAWKTYEGVIIEDVLIEYSTNDGRNWNCIGAVANTGSYDWPIPAINSNQCLVRIADLNEPAISDISYRTFRIVCPGDFEPDGDVDFGDFAVLAQSWKTTVAQPNYHPQCDISETNDDLIDYGDLSVFAGYWLTGKK